MILHNLAKLCGYFNQISPLPHPGFINTHLISLVYMCILNTNMKSIDLEEDMRANPNAHENPQEKEKEWEIKENNDENMLQLSTGYARNRTRITSNF